MDCCKCGKKCTGQLLTCDLNNNHYCNECSDKEFGKGTKDEQEFMKMINELNK